MDEILEKFNEIKSKKTKPSKILNEIADILSATYKTNPNLASSMWQYIIDLNVGNNTSNAKFYVAQVFNKLIDRMSDEDSTALIAMIPERVRLVIYYGYKGKKLWRCLCVLMRGFIKMNSIENAVVCVNIFLDKFGGMFSENPEIIKIIQNIVDICNELVAEGDFYDEIETFYDSLNQSLNRELTDALLFFRFINGYSVIIDFEPLFRAALKYKPVEYFNLLWLARENYNTEELKEKWIKYLNFCIQENIRPYNYFNESKENYYKSRTYFYVELEKSTDKLLEYYFNRPSLYSIENAIIWDWIKSGDWDRFIKYVSMSIMTLNEKPFNCCSIKVTLQQYMDACFYDNQEDLTDRFDRSYKILMKSRTKQFCKALAQIAIITIGCECHEDLLEWVKNYIQKQNGNLDILNQFGFKESIDKRPAEERLIEYINNFLKSGKYIHNSQSIKYISICRALFDERIRNKSDKIKIHIKITINADGTITSETVRTKNEEWVDEELEQLYRLVLVDSVVDFYFLHCPHECNMRTKMISACVKKDNINRAMELIDLMASTKNNLDYDEPNGWGRQNMLTIMYLIREYDCTSTSEWDSQEITEEMRQVVKQLVYRMIPSLPEHSKEELKKDLYRINKDTFANSEEYINQILDIADLYSTFPKPRGKGNDQEVNRMSDELISCFEHLSKIGRTDVVGKIMTKFATVKDILAPVTYERWMSFMAGGVSSKDLVFLFKNYPEIFDAWLDVDNLNIYRLYRIAENFGSACTRNEFLSFRNKIIEHKGLVKGIDAAFKADSENTQTIELFKSQNAIVKLDYIEQICHPISSATFHFIMQRENKNIESIRIYNCKINNIEVSEKDMYTTFNYKKPISRFVEDDHNSSMTISTNFFRSNEIAQIDTIKFLMFLVDKNGNEIEHSQMIELKLDLYSGEYKLI